MEKKPWIVKKGQELRRIRMKKQMTQEALGKELGFSGGCVSKFETAEASRKGLTFKLLNAWLLKELKKEKAQAQSLSPGEIKEVRAPRKLIPGDSLMVDFVETPPKVVANFTANMWFLFVNLIFLLANVGVFLTGYASVCGF